MSSQHVVQFYSADENALIQSVGRYVIEGLDDHKSIVLVTNRARQDALFALLDRFSPDLVVMDSERILDQLYDGGALSARRFDQVIGRTLRDVVSRSRSQGVRVYGDIVDTLWRLRRLDDALELERFWNDLQAQLPFDLYCAYGIDLSADSDAEAIASMLREHTAVVPNRRNRELQNALEYAMYETFGQDLPRLTDAETTILWLREHVPQQAGEILSRARKYATG